jgi:hypothetical protein
MASINFNIDKMTEDEIKNLYYKYKIEVNEKIISIQNKSLEKYYILIDDKNNPSCYNLYDKIFFDAMVNESDYFKSIYSFVKNVEKKYTFMNVEIDF